MRLIELPSVLNNATSYSDVVDYDNFQGLLFYVDFGASGTAIDCQLTVDIDTKTIVKSVSLGILQQISDLFKGATLPAGSDKVHLVHVDFGNYAFPKPVRMSFGLSNNGSALITSGAGDKKIKAFAIVDKMTDAGRYEYVQKTTDGDTIPNCKYLFLSKANAIDSEIYVNVSDRANNWSNTLMALASMMNITSRVEVVNKDLAMLYNKQGIVAPVTYNFSASHSGIIVGVQENPITPQMHNLQRERVMLKNKVREVDNPKLSRELKVASPRLAEAILE